jgi:DNA gyrase/topoisomerase IV subunit A
MSDLETENFRLRNLLRENAKSATASVDFLRNEQEENRRLRDACRQTNKGIGRLRRRCDAQAKKIEELKEIVREAIALGIAPARWVEAVDGRRPSAQKSSEAVTSGDPESRSSYEPRRMFR